MAARPGQFAMLYPGGDSRLLPRPISFCGADEKNGLYRFVYQAAGGGTTLLAALEPGRTIRALAPLGNGFPETRPGERAAIIGGGLGVPPLLWLTRSRAASGAEVSVFLGFRSDPILLREFAETGAGVSVSTDDGSMGFHGNAADMFENFADEPAFDTVYACGPKPLLARAAGIAEKIRAACYVSVEERMACGVGACYCCAVETRGETKYRKCCADGPVFDAKELVWGAGAVG